MEIRRVRESEWEELRNTRLRALSDAPDAFESRYADAVQRADDWWIDWARRSAGGEGQAMFLAWNDDAPIGIVGAFVEGGRCWLISMWTDPSVRGRGIGTGLIEAAADFARTCGHAELQLAVRFENEPARRLYERCGFLETDEVAAERIMKREL